MAQGFQELISSFTFFKWVKIPSIDYNYDLFRKSEYLAFSYKTPQFLEKSKKSLADGGSSGKLLTKGSLKKNAESLVFTKPGGGGYPPTKPIFGFFLRNLVGLTD